MACGRVLLSRHRPHMTDRNTRTHLYSRTRPLPQTHKTSVTVSLFTRSRLSLKFPNLSFGGLLSEYAARKIRCKGWACSTTNRAIWPQSTRSGLSLALLSSHWKKKRKRQNTQAKQKRAMRRENDRKQLGCVYASVCVSVEKDPRQQKVYGELTQRVERGVYVKKKEREN